MGICASAGSGGDAAESESPIAVGEAKLLAELRHMWSDSGGSVVIDIPVRVLLARGHITLYAGCVPARPTRASRIVRAH